MTAVVAGSTSSRFRQGCLRTMQVEDTPALVATAQQSLAEVTQQRLLPGGSCETPGDSWDPRRGSPSEHPRVQRGQMEEKEDEEGPQSSQGQVLLQEMAQRMA